MMRAALLLSMIATAHAADVSWESYNNKLTGLRFSELDEINIRTVAKLREVCRVHVSGPGPFSSGITVVNGELFVTSTLSIMQPRAPMPKVYPEPLSEQDVRDVARYISADFRKE